MATKYKQVDVTYQQFKGYAYSNDGGQTWGYVGYKDGKEILRGNEHWENVDSAINEFERDVLTWYKEYHPEYLWPKNKKLIKNKKSNPTAQEHKNVFSLLFHNAMRKAMTSDEKRILKEVYYSESEQELRTILDEKILMPNSVDFICYKISMLIDSRLLNKTNKKSNPLELNDSDDEDEYGDFVEGFAEAEKILSRFIKDAGGKDVAVELISESVFGELPEFTAKGLNGYMVYGNREASIYVDDVEEPYSLHVDIYGDRKSLVWG